MPSTFSDFFRRARGHLRCFWQRQVMRWKAWRSNTDATTEKTYLATLTAPDPSRRWQAAAGLGRNPQRSPDAIAALVEALADPEPFVRWQAAEALSAQETSHVHPVLIATLDAPEPLRRAGAAHALGIIGGEAAAQVLIRHLDDPVSDVRAAVASAIGRVCDPTKIPALLPLLSDEDPDVRRAAAGALGRIGDPVAAAPLAEALVRPEQPVLVRRALAAAILRAPHPDAQPALLRALTDPDAQVRGYAAEALGHVGNEAAHDALASVRTDQSALLKGTVGDRAARALVLLERRGRRVVAAHHQTEEATR